MTSDAANIAATEDAPPSPRMASPPEGLFVFLKLGVSCFGGRIAISGISARNCRAPALAKG